MFGFLRNGDRLAALERSVRKLEESERTRSVGLVAQITRLADAAAQQPTAKDLRELRQAVRTLASRDDRQTLDEIGRAVAGGRPIVVGPWTGELGFELLYWIPFVNWVRRQWDVPDERLFVVSRGGVGAWYGVPEGQYADVFSFITPDQFRTAVMDAKRKQRRESSFDATIIETVREARGLGEYGWLHPGAMYRLFAPYWSDEAGYARIDQFTRYRLLPPPPAVGSSPLTASLPEEYVAVRFYFSECFPETPANRSFARLVVLSLAERHPVVLLNPGFQVDEHADWTTTPDSRVRVIADQLPPAANLAIQADVIRRARAFVGTYGGYSYLAPMCGVPALAFHSRTTFKRHHLHAAERALDAMGAAPLTVLDAAAAPLARTALDALEGVRA